MKEAVSYPAANISRDKVFPQLFKFKSQADKLIVLYMLDERAGTAVAKLLAEKGYDNLYLLSGGIEHFQTEFPDLIEGAAIPPPKPISQKENKKPRNKWLWLLIKIS